MTTGIDYAEAQTWLEHFRSKGCDADIVANTEGVFNLCWFYAGLVDQLKQELEKKTVNIVRLNEIIYGQGKCPEDATEAAKTSEELTSSPTSTSDTDDTSPHDNPSKPELKPKPKAKGHGRYSVNDYPGAEVVVCSCDLKVGDPCPQCQQAKLQWKPPTIKIQIDGQPPLPGKRYELEKLACPRCPFEMTAQAPVDLSKKYTEKAKATLAYLHYAMGLPYYRFSKMQAMLGVPIAVSTQSELIASMMGAVHPVFNALVIYAAQSGLFYQDDTSVVIHSLIKENKLDCPTRKGMYTSGFIAEGEYRVVLYFSGRAHAGENFDKLMAHRQPNKGKPTRMADALSANRHHEASATDAKCNSHAFRRFRSLLSIHPEQAAFVLHCYGQIYDNDQHCKNHKMDDPQRLRYHQKHSQPVMDALKSWAEKTLADGSAEPNGVLAAECRYLLTHWLGLTLFLRVLGAPLDNNILEAMLKYMITYRKNSQCFRTVYSAEYGSRLISIIVTCMVNGIDAIDYLTQLQCHEQDVWRDPAAWLPWRYRETLCQLSQPQATPSNAIAGQQAA